MLQHLALAERHILEGEQRLLRQQELIAELDRDGHDTGQARIVLTTLQDTQFLHYQDRELILSELGQVGLAATLSVSNAGRRSGSKGSRADISGGPDLAR